MAKIKDNTSKINITDGVIVPENDEKSIFSAWKISFTGAILLLVLLPVLSPDP